MPAIYSSFFENDTDGLKRVKAIVKKAISAKKHFFKINSIFLPENGKGKWATDCFYKRKIISDVAVIVCLQLGSGLSFRLYSDVLYVDGIGAIDVVQPKDEQSAELWLKKYDTKFANYQDHLIKNN